MIRKLSWGFGVLLVGLALGKSSFAYYDVNLTGQRYLRGNSPTCLDGNGASLPIDDAAVIRLEATSPEQYHARAHVEGPVVELFNDATGHNHFEIQIGPNPRDVLEVIYSQDFGALPEMQLGMVVEACGDYITSRQQDGPYPPSPAGAIIHWVHENPSGHGHPSGFLMINGVLYGNRPTGNAR